MLWTDATVVMVVVVLLTWHTREGVAYLVWIFLPGISAKVVGGLMGRYVGASYAGVLPTPI